MYTKVKNLPKTGKSETGKKHVFSLEILDTETPKNEKLGKIVTQRNQPFYSICPSPLNARQVNRDTQQKREAVLWNSWLKCKAFKGKFVKKLEDVEKIDRMGSTLIRKIDSLEERLT